MTANKPSTPVACPACGNALEIVTLHCPACRTSVEGAFPLPRFLRLPPDQLEFCATFLRCRGNLKDVGAVLDISYPTARNRLDALLEALDFSDARPEKRQQERMEILDRVADGSLSPEDAVAMLKGDRTP